MHHQMAREAGDQLARLQHLEAFRFQARAIARGRRPRASSAASSGRAPASPAARLSAAPSGQPSRMPPIRPPSSRIVSGQANTIGFSGGQCAASASAAAFMPAKNARRARRQRLLRLQHDRAPRRDRTAASTRACPRPARPRSRPPCANASPSSRSPTARKPGGRSRLVIWRLRGQRLTSRTSKAADAHAPGPQLRELHCYMGHRLA